MEKNELLSVSPLDGRYQSQTKPLSRFFSEHALIQYRVRIEIEYFIALTSLSLPELSNIPLGKIEQLKRHIDSFDISLSQRVKEIEKTTNHDVKAVEYLLRELFDELKLSEYKEFIHFGLTSQDINNTAMPMMLRDALNEVITPAIHDIKNKLFEMSVQWANVPMLARTHGQPASPTRLGKEIKVFAERLDDQLKQLDLIQISGKFGGATGNFNAHSIAYPKIDWVNFANNFLRQQLKIERQQTTTQIEHYDNMAAIFDCIKRINTILIDFARDVWTYVMLEYFKQQTKKGEVGSSAMPHKVNPIDFENAEGNLGIANALFEHLSGKLPLSRLQRDLTDSTVSRNIGVPLAHCLIAYNSLIKGMGKLLINPDKIKADLNANWAVLAEAIQTILRREKYPDPYNALKELTRGQDGITQESLRDFIEKLNVKETVKSELRLLTPETYTGI